MLSISIEHDPRSGTWDVGHTGPGGHKGRWNTVIPPRYPTWRSSCSCLPADGQFAEDAATELGRVVRGVQSRCSCRQCGKALESTEWLDPAAAQVRRIPIYVPERAEPVAWTDAEVSAEAYRMHREITGLLAEQKGIARKQAAEVAALNKSLAASRSAAKPPVSYATARERYMATGTIAHKEAMLEFVTADYPCDDELRVISAALANGREQEPGAQARSGQAPRRPLMRRASLAFVLAAVVLTAVNGLFLGSSRPITITAFACLAAWGLLYRKPGIR